MTRLHREGRIDYVKLANATRWTNTRPERAVEAALREAGIGHEREQWIGPYRVDFLYGWTIVEVYGCYWHGCPCRDGHPPGIDEKRARDERRVVYLRDAGYRVETVWEHEAAGWTPGIPGDYHGSKGAVTGLVTSWTV